jgi:hypothetical protein
MKNRDGVAQDLFRIEIAFHETIFLLLEPSR